MKSLFLSISSICFFLFSALVYADNSVSGKRLVVVGGDYNFAPYEYTDNKGNVTGYNVEVTRAIAEVMGLNVEVRLGNWDDMRQGLVAGDIDIVQGMTIAEGRREEFSFSPPTAFIQQSIFARSDYEPVERLDQLIGSSVIVQSKGSVHDYLLQSGLNVTIIPAKTHVDALRLLSSGQHDYAIVANLPGLYWEQELDLNNIQLVGTPYASKGYGYAVVKGNEQLLSQFSEGLAILKNTGKLQKIYDKWLGVLEDRVRFDWQRFMPVIVTVTVLLVLVMSAIIIWNRMLKYQVDKRTEERNLQQKQLIQADKMTSLGVLVSGIGHEINNPTGLLLLNLPVVKDAWSDSQHILEQYYLTHGDFSLAGLKYSRLRTEIPFMIDEMQEGAERIKGIVDDLKDFSRKEEVSEKRFINLNEVVAKSIRLAKHSINESTDHFRVSCDSYLPLVFISAQRIEQVIINLIVNACQALTSREQLISIKTYYDDVKKMVALEIIDQGVGIEKDNLSRLTDPFFTTKRHEGGTGLGLSISAGIVLAHDGLLKFSSVIGQGTIATMTLPITRNNDYSH